MSSTDNSQKTPIGCSPEELEQPEKLLQLKITCKGCWQLVDRAELIDYLNDIHNTDEPVLVASENEVYHNEACLNYAMCGEPFSMVVEANPHVDFLEIERLFPRDLDRKAWIREVDRRIRRLPTSQSLKQS